jgi:acetoacetate decarboxylase
MRKYYATKGKIPKIGEVWVPVGDKAHLMMVHLIDIKRIREFIPEELTIKTVLPGKTLGLVFMTSMGPESTLPYHEFIIAPAFVKAKKKSGFYVTHIFVDNEKSQIGGRSNFGLDKQMAEFDWDWKQGKNGLISIIQNGQNIFSLKYKAQFGRLPVRLGGGVFSILEDKLIWCNNIFNAKFGLTKVEYNIPKDTLIQNDLLRIGIKKPILSVMGEEMRGYMGDDTQVVAFLPDRNK